MQLQLNLHCFTVYTLTEVTESPPPSEWHKPQLYVHKLNLDDNYNCRRVEFLFLLMASERS